jgi:peptidyl-dipeptidase Dcp
MVMHRRSFVITSACAGAYALLRPRCMLAARSTMNADHPLLAEWTGPLGGYPRFDHVDPAAFPDALRMGIELARKDIAVVADASAAPTFTNSVAALEDASRPLARARSLFGVYVSTMADKPMLQIEEQMAPVLAAHDDEVTQNAKLFTRISAVHGSPGKLTAEQQRLLEVIYRAFARQGAALDASRKARLATINQRLASLYTTFGQNELADEEGYTLALSRDDELVGLPDGVKAAMKSAAEAKGLTGWLITNTRSSVEPFLTYARRRDLRERAWRMWVKRGDNGDAHDNKPVITEILSLRAERAKLLGFASHAHWIIDDNMARTPDAAMSLMRKVWKAAVARAKEDIAELQQLATADHVTIEAWDHRYYAEKLRKAKYDLDHDEISKYLVLDNLRDAMFWAAGQLYGFAFERRPQVPAYHSDVTVYEVLRDGKHVGLWYFDPYARPGKRSGAWMNEYRTQESWKHAVPTIVSNNANFVKGKSGEPVLISWDDAVTMFHEFGHALHGLNSDVAYATLAGTNVKRDFVEFPSQLNEHWLPTTEVLSKFAVHYQTGKPIPAELVAKIDRARHFNQGFKTVEYLASAIYDLQIHLEPTEWPIDPAAFEQRVMRDLGMPREIVMRHRPTQFGHIFSGDGYSAGYYAYIWADTLTADAAEAFAQAGSFYDRATAKRLHDAIMSVGNSISPEDAFRRFRGRDVDTNALMRDRGFPTT